MTIQYLLPCSCGQKVPVAVSQAGEAVSCSCGSRLEVPTMRGLERLERIALLDAPAPTWGRRQGLLLFGTIVAVAAFGWSAYLFANRPQLDLDAIRREAEDLSLAQSWQAWRYYEKGGMPLRPTSSGFKLMDDTATYQTRLAIALALGVGGLLTAASGFFVKPGRW